MPSSCKNEEQLSDYLIGRLDETSATEVENHVRSCPDCCETLRTCVPDEDMVIAALKHSVGQPEATLVPQLQQALQLIKSMRTDLANDEETALIAADATGVETVS